MIIIADSGSTKTAWRLIDSSGTVSATSTFGLNPLALDKQAILAELQDSELAQWAEGNIEELHFYSAGIIDAAQETITAATLKLFFKSADIIVASDLLGAARAVFGNEAGIIGILGTGSNSGYYNGNEITGRIPSLGYLLGDEGSGAVLGRSLLRMFFRNELPDEIMTDLKVFYPDYSSLVATIYSEKHAARLMASFVPFIYDNRNDESIKALVMTELGAYINLLQRYPEHQKLGLVGSVGYLFKEELEELTSGAGIEIIDCLQSPIERLTLYHQNLST